MHMSAAAAVMALLSACGSEGAAAGAGSGNPLPTPKPAENVGASARSAAAHSYQKTWDSYLKDALPPDNQVQGIKIAMLERYEKQSITQKDLGGIRKQTDLVADRTKFNLTNSGSTASAVTDFDVRITFANGDTSTRTCKFQVAIEQNPADKLWYVLNPAPFPVDNVCSTKS